MNKTVKIVIVIILIVVVGVVIAVKQNSKTSISEPAATTISNLDTQPEKAVNLPLLVDLGAGKCIPCKMMKPILDELKQEYKERFHVTVIDVWENPNAGEKYGIRLIPTQIFFDAAGKELFRHEGFYSKEDILGKWKELGIELKR
ncbi:MAG: thioredoxin family protein [Sedimentisphaerales bacterium]|nr:thioredoxin family protein [Sedimentisphaerales bacterium]